MAALVTLLVAWLGMCLGLVLVVTVPLLLICGALALMWWPKYGLVWRVVAAIRKPK